MARGTGELWTAWTARRDEHAFELLVRPELPHVFSFARRLGCSAPEAEDALQAALARLAAVRDDAPVAVGLRTWLCREIHTRARSRLRSERRRRTRESVVAVPAVQDRADDPVALRDEVARVLAGLPEHQRVAVELRYLHDLDYREMALVLRVPEGTCRQRVSRALAELRKRFGQGAAAIVAALPLPEVRSATTLVKGALAKSAAATTTGWGVSVAMSMKKVTVVVLAVAAGVVGTLGLQVALVPGDRAVRSRSGPSAAALERAEKEREIAGLRRQLAAAQAREYPGAGSVAPNRSSADPPKAGANGGDARSYVARGELWRAAIYQLADPGKRHTAWAAVRAALAGDDRNALLAALWTVTFTSHIKLERDGLRAQLDAFLAATDPETRRLAWKAVIAMERVARATGSGSGLEAAMIDKLRQQTAASPTEIRSSMLLSLLEVSGYVVDGPTADVVLALLEDEAGRSETFRGLGRAKRLSDPVVAKLLTYARGSPKVAAQVNLVVRHLDEKSRDLIEYLLESAEAGTPGALWALRGGVRPEDRAFVGRHLRKLFDARIEPLLRREIVTTIGYMGDTSLREWLTRLRDSEELSSGLRFAATVALRNLDRPRR